MSTAIQSAVRELEQEIEAIDQRRGELVRAIDTLRPLAAVNGSGGRHLSRTNERTNERTKQGAGQRAAEPP